MADDGSGGLGGFLGSLGRGISTGLGTALTPIAMLMAARSGRNPFDVLASGENTQLEQELRRAQIARAQQDGLFERIAGLQDPGVRGYAVENPSVAPQLGLETVPGGIASPEVLNTAGIRSGAAGRDVPMLPARVATYEDARRRLTEGQARWYDKITGGGGADVGGIGPEGEPLPTTTGNPALMPAAAGMQPGPGVGGGGARMVPRSTTIGTSGPSTTYGPEQVRELTSGTKNEQGVDYKTGDYLPSGERVLVKPSTVSQAQAGQLTRIRAARAALKLFTNPINPETGDPDPKGKRPIDSLPDGAIASGIRTVVPPGVMGIPVEFRAGMGDAPSAFMVAGSSQRAGVVKALGDSGNLSEQEQTQIEKAFLPNIGDTKKLGEFKLKYADRLFQTIEDQLAAGNLPLGTPDPNRPGDTPEAAGIREALLTAAVAPPTTGEGTGPDATPGGTTPPAAESPEMRLRNKYGITAAPR